MQQGRSSQDSAQATPGGASADDESQSRESTPEAPSSASLVDIAADLAALRREQLNLLGELRELVAEVDRTRDAEPAEWERPALEDLVESPLDRAAAPLFARLRTALESGPLRRADARLGPRVRLRRRLNALIDKVVFHQAEHRPRLWADYVVWRAKHGPKKHELRLPKSASGTRAWLRTRTRPHDDHVDAKLRVLTLGRPQLVQRFGGLVEARESTPTSWQADLEEVLPDVVVVDVRALHEYRHVPGFGIAALKAACESTGATPVVWADAHSLDITPDAEQLDVPHGTLVLVDVSATARRLAHLGIRATTHVIGPSVDTKPDELPALPRASLLLCGKPTGAPSIDALRETLPSLEIKHWGSSSPGAEGPPQLAILTADLHDATGPQLEELGRALARGTVLFAPHGSGPRHPAPWHGLPCTRFDPQEPLASRINDFLERPAALHAAAHRSTRFARRHLSPEAAFLRFAAHAGAPALLRRPRLVSVLCVSNRPQRVRSCLEAYRNQTYPHKELVFGANLDHLDDEWVERFIAERADVVLLRTNGDYSLGESLNRARVAARGDVWTKFDDDDYYGPRYLEDLVLALESSRAAVVGKGTFYSYVEGRDELYLTPQAPENQFSDRYVHGGTITADRRAVEAIDFLPVRRGTDSLFLQQCKLADLRIYSADRYNFAYIRYQDPGHHTFDVANQDFLRSCRFVSRGFDKSLIEV